MMDKILNSVKIAFSIIGAIIGAGFITGREIVRFFYGGNCILSAIILSIFLFLFVWLMLLPHSEKIEKIISFANGFICVFNIIIIASMLGATDSLFNGLLGFDKKLPLFSICLLLLSTVVCFKGIEWINRVNFFLIPLMIFFLLVVLMGLPISNDYLVGGFPSINSIILYASLNCLLSQPFIIKLKEREKNFSPLISALTVSTVLSIFVFLYIRVLNSDCMLCDIPILSLLSKGTFKHLMATVVIFYAIVSTQVGSHYPIIKSLQNKRTYNITWVLTLNLIAFAISRIGFYKIVDILYPLIAVIACVYFVVISILTVLFPAVKLKDT